jgi:hypothetical protein
MSTRSTSATQDQDHRCGEQGDRLHAVLCAAGYNIRWLLRMMAKKGVTFLWRLYLRLRWLACGGNFTPSAPLGRSARPVQRLSISRV